MAYVYVAGSSDQLERAKSAIKALEDRGHVVTHNWVELVEAVGSANPVDASRAERRKWAADDLRGVHKADIMWLLMPHEGGFGAAVELGYALAHGIPIIASGTWTRSIFTAFATCYDRDDLALAAEFDVNHFECDCRECVRTETTGPLEGMN